MTSSQTSGVVRAHSNGPARPPPLPPRTPSAMLSSTSLHDPSLDGLASHDPRSSSTQSLIPETDAESMGRRRLLLIYIHGFMGDETSFQSFPAHVHNLAKIMLADSHVVHTKIYPKYKSRNSLNLARDQFSAWLAPHETPTTDVILLGHSMGGLLAADVTLLLRHHIIGTVNFDTPFLGMHPGVVKAGLGSIFNPAPAAHHQGSVESSEADGNRPSRMNTLFSPKPLDPNYNPAFNNDIRTPVRKGWESTLHFLNKHSNGLVKASRDYVTSHLQFGGAMADYSTLKERYARIRALEEDDERKRRSAFNSQLSPPRIRFVNYYTASTGRPKRPKSPSSRPGSASTGMGGISNHKASNSVISLETPQAEHGPVSPRISVEEHRDGVVIPIIPEEPPSPEDAPTSGLPDIPPMPEEPEFVDLSKFTDKAERKAAEKERSRALKEYQRAVKQRDSAIKQRTKAEQKPAKQKSKESRQAQPASSGEASWHGPALAESNGQSSTDKRKSTLELGTPEQSHDGEHPPPYSNYEFSRSVILNAPEPDDHSSLSTETSAADTPNELTNVAPNSIIDQSTTPPKRKRLGKFCRLPPKDASGNTDPTWIRVFMEGVDEVGAHCGLFFMSETYERLVGDVSARLEEWVREAESLRVVRELEGSV